MARVTGMRRTGAALLQKGRESPLREGILRPRIEGNGLDNNIECRRNKPRDLWCTLCLSVRRSALIGGVAPFCRFHADHCPGRGHPSLTHGVVMSQQE